MLLCEAFMRSNILEIWPMKNNIQIRFQLFLIIIFSFVFVVFLTPASVTVAGNDTRLANQHNKGSKASDNNQIAAKDREDGAKIVGDFVKDVANKVAAVLNSKIAPNAKSKQLTEIFYSIADYEWMAKFVVARHWRSMSQTQQQSYIEAYKHYLAHSYVKHFNEYNGQRFEFGSISEVNTSNYDGQYMVSVTIVQKNSDTAPINILYRLKMYSKNSIKIIDIIADNVSLLATQREDFNSVITRSGVPTLIENLRNAINS